MSARPGGRPALHWSAILLLLLVLPLAFLTWRAFRSWAVARAAAAEVEKEAAGLKSRNAVLARAHETVQDRRFQMCNKSPDEVEVTWLAAAHEERGTLQVFDSARCRGWQSQLVPAGGSPKLFTFSSPEEGCNWDGSVIFYGIRFVRRTEDGATLEYSMVGPWQGFDRDCFTIQ